MISVFDGIARASGMRLELVERLYLLCSQAARPYDETLRMAVLIQKLYPHTAEELIHLYEAQRLKEMQG